MNDWSICCFRGLLQSRNFTWAVPAAVGVPAEEDDPGCLRGPGEGQGAGECRLLQPLRPLRSQAPEPDREGAEPLQDLRNQTPVHGEGWARLVLGLPEFCSNNTNSNDMSWSKPNLIFVRKSKEVEVLLPSILPNPTMEDIILCTKYSWATELYLVP